MQNPDPDRADQLQARHHRPRVRAVREDAPADRDVMQQCFGDGGLLGGRRVQDRNRRGAQDRESGGRSEPGVERRGRTAFGCGEHSVQLCPDV
jgi:hypothetical protein